MAHSNKDYLMPSLDPNISNAELAHRRRLQISFCVCGHSLETHRPDNNHEYMICCAEKCNCQEFRIR